MFSLIICCFSLFFQTFYFICVHQVSVRRFCHFHWKFSCVRWKKLVKWTLFSLNLSLLHCKKSSQNLEFPLDSSISIDKYYSTYLLSWSLTASFYHWSRRISPTQMIDIFRSLLRSYGLNYKMFEDSDKENGECWKVPHFFPKCLYY